MLEWEVLEALEMAVSRWERQVLQALDLAIPRWERQVLSGEVLEALVETLDST